MSDLLTTVRNVNRFKNLHQSMNSFQAQRKPKVLRILQNFLQMQRTNVLGPTCLTLKYFYSSLFYFYSPSLRPKCPVSSKISDPGFIIWPATYSLSDSCLYDYIETLSRTPPTLWLVTWIVMDCHICHSLLDHQMHTHYALFIDCYLQFNKNTPTTAYFLPAPVFDN